MENLTIRENDILFWLTKGCKNKEIAMNLNLSIHTIKTNLENIYIKLGVSNRTQAAIIAVRMFE